MRRRERSSSVWTGRTAPAPHSSSRSTKPRGVAPPSASCWRCPRPTTGRPRTACPRPCSRSCRTAWRRWRGTWSTTLVRERGGAVGRHPGRGPRRRRLTGSRSGGTVPRRGPAGRRPPRAGRVPQCPARIGRPAVRRARVRPRDGRPARPAGEPGLNGYRAARPAHDRSATGADGTRGDGPSGRDAVGYRERSLVGEEQSPAFAAARRRDSECLRQGRPPDRSQRDRARIPCTVGAQRPAVALDGRPARRAPQRRSDALAARHRRRRQGPDRELRCRAPPRPRRPRRGGRPGGRPPHPEPRRTGPAGDPRAESGQDHRGGPRPRRRHHRSADRPAPLQRLADPRGLAAPAGGRRGRTGCDPADGRRRRAAGRAAGGDSRGRGPAEGHAGIRDGAGDVDRPSSRRRRRPRREPVARENRRHPRLP